MTPSEKKARADLLKPLNQKRATLQTEIEKLDKTILNRSLDKLESFEANWTRPSTNRTGTEDTFAPIEAKFVRLVCEAQDLNPETSNGFRLDEFEVWSAESKPRNVALASNGGVARARRGKLRISQMPMEPNIPMMGRSEPASLPLQKASR